MITNLLNLIWQEIKEQRLNRSDLTQSLHQLIIVSRLIKELANNRRQASCGQPADSASSSEGSTDHA